MTIVVTPGQHAFLARFVSRGWIHAARDDAWEREAVDLAVRKRWARREANEAHFTSKGRQALLGGD